jgi:excisionase family DNA binding protein
MERAMALRINGAVSAKDVADARQQARVLKTAVVGRHPSAQVEIKAGTLKSILKVVDAVSVELLESKGVVSRTTSAELKTEIDEISPQEAADILQMSRPSVMRLIEKGFLHPRKVLSRNRLSRAEVMAYQHKHALQQRQALAHLTALAEEYDF